MIIHKDKKKYALKALQIYLMNNYQETAIKRESIFSLKTLDACLNQSKIWKNIKLEYKAGHLVRICTTKNTDELKSFRRLIMILAPWIEQNTSIQQQFMIPSSDWLQVKSQLVFFSKHQTGIRQTVFFQNLTQEPESLKSYYFKSISGWFPFIKKGTLIEEKFIKVKTGPEIRVFCQNTPAAEFPIINCEIPPQSRFEIISCCLTEFVLGLFISELTENKTNLQADFPLITSNTVTNRFLAFYFIKENHQWRQVSLLNNRIENIQDEQIIRQAIATLRSLNALTS